LILFRGGWINETYFPHGECEFPYEGNLCNQCAPNYAKFGSNLYLNNGNLIGNKVDLVVWVVQLIKCIMLSLLVSF